MTLIVHIIHKEFQLVALDGRLLPVGTEENFKKHITYNNGLIYFLNEYNDKNGKWITELIREKLPEGKSILDFDEFVQRVFDISFKENDFKNTAIMLCATIEDKQFCTLITNDNRKNMEINTLFISKPELRKFFSVSDISSLKYDYENLCKIIDEFYSEAIKDDNYDNSFNNKLNIIGFISKVVMEKSREDNTIRI